MHSRGLEVSVDGIAIKVCLLLGSIFGFHFKGKGWTPKFTREVIKSKRWEDIAMGR